MPAADLSPPGALLRAAVASLAVHVPLLREIGDRFVAAGHEVALVGGPVRDAFLGRSAPDLDFTTDATPEQTLQVVGTWADAHWDIGRAFGTIGVRKGPHVLEFTTYRADTYEEDSRKPAVTFGRDLAQDLVRRDFTVNAMAMRLPSLEFVDLNDGLVDLAARRLRTPGPAARSFSDDPLRMLRAARFAAQLGLVPTSEVREAMTRQAARLGKVSAERIRDEFTKLLLSEDPRSGLSLLVETSVADHFLPELPALQLEIDEHHRHKDVYEHTLTVLEQSMALQERSGGEPDLVLRLAALLHDIGKPATRRFEAGGGVSFHHHELVGARMTTRRLRAMRFEKEVVTAVARLVELHLRFHGYGGGKWTDSAVRRYVTDAGPLLERLHLLTRSDCTTRDPRRAARLARSYDDLERRIARLAEQEELAAIRPELNGHEIADALGIAPGPILGRAYQFLLQVRLDEGPIGAEAARERLVAWWAEQPEAGAGA